MKTVISATENKLTSKFDLRFGRAGWFCVFNESTENIQFYKNEHQNAQGGAGSKAAEKMAELGITKVISGDFGPKAKDLLNKFNIQMIILPDENNTIQEIIDKIKN